MLKYAMGFIEVQGYSVALAAMDKACKAADIKIEGMDCNNPALGDKANIPVMIQVKFTGKLSDVQIALEVARETARQYIDEKDIQVHCITSSYDDIAKLLKLGKVKIKR